MDDDRGKEAFSSWAAANEHNIMTSFPKSGRNYLGALIRRASGKRVINGISPIEPDVFLYMAHRGRWSIRGDKGRYILLIRDPRDAILSRTYTQAIEASESTEHLISREDWLIENIGNWLGYFTEFMQYEPHLVRYESLCLQPATTLSVIFQFLGIEAVEDLGEVIAGNDLRKPDPMEPRGFVPTVFKTGLERYNAHCLKWERDPLVTESYLDIIWREAATVMEEFGYTELGHNGIKIYERANLRDVSIA